MGLGSLILKGMESLVGKTATALERSENRRRERQGLGTAQDRALDLAAMEGRVADARRLLKEGASPDPTSALIWAAARDSDALLRAFLKAGASPDGARSAAVVTPLMQAARTGNGKSLEALIQAGARLDLTLDDMAPARPKEKLPPGLVSPSDWTALMWAASSGREQSARRLVDAGARLDRLNTQGQSAEDLARAAGHEGVAELLRAEAQKVELGQVAAPGALGPRAARL